MEERITIYQVLPRLFGNEVKKNTSNGDINENGCGKFNYFTNKALKEIRKMGFSHIWYTGIIAHASQTDYSTFGIPQQYPEIIKGKAGSPYAIRDYYDVSPDLAVNVNKRMQEFEELVDRTHKNGMKVVIDFVPNHLARNYRSIMKPEFALEFGITDDSSYAFLPSNNFYYIPGSSLDLRSIEADENIFYQEDPAMATGNDCFNNKPTPFDWYETVKLNYGVDYLNKMNHFSPIPDTWYKMKDILMFWAEKKVDAFRCDMAEMVPIEFWEWVIPRIKKVNSEILFIAEIYNKEAYRTYLSQNAFDYLYDKVGLYDTLRDVSVGQRCASDITFTLNAVGDIQHRMLNFLENHDEQRIASEFFLNDAKRALPAMILTAFISTNPIMIYFGQELGEKGMDKEGFSGRDGRTTIFDYWAIDKMSRWCNNGKWNHTLLTKEERDLKNIYKDIVTLCSKEYAFTKGKFYDLMYANYDNLHFDSTKLFAFLRGWGNDLFLVIVNFADNDVSVNLNIPVDALNFFEKDYTQNQMAKPILRYKKDILKFVNSHTLEVSISAFNGEVFKITF